MTSRNLSRHALLMAGCAALAAPALAEAPSIDGRSIQDATTSRLPAGKSTERVSVADQGNIPFRISVDGNVVDRSGAPVAPPERQVDRQRQTDVALDAVDIQVKFDGLEVQPRLNVSTDPIQRSYRAGETIRFRTSSNYPAFVQHAEIRIYEAGNEGVAPVDVVPVALNGEAAWRMPTRAAPDLHYVLRVYDAQGRFDETEPLSLARSARELPALSAPEAAAPGEGEDRTAIRNIPVRGGAVTVYGSHVPAGFIARALGEEVPLDPGRAFVVQRILPPGQRDVDVAVRSEHGKDALHFSRDINIPSDDWFYVGLADLTVGKRTGDAEIEAVRPGEYDEVYSRGRLAFYLKGKIKGEYLLTAAADTTEEELDQIFNNLDEKDPRQLLRRLDPDDHYPVYGDDSTMIEDAPTNGRFYVRLERGDSHVMWGNYKTRIEGTEFLRAERGLYGANVVHRSEDTTSFGARRSEVTLYAAQPDTLPRREEFRGTGGSAYFLQRQDVVAGSETIVVEVRDKTTGRVVDRSLLRYGEDYSLDYIQGVLILQQPLSSATGATGPVRDGALGGNEVYLVAQYEYEPVAGDVDGYAYGGRAQHWLNDKLRVGVTGMRESTGPADQRAYGGDIVYRQSERTFLEAEAARSRGPGFGLSRSTDGGLTFGEEGAAGDDDHAATAVRLAGQMALDEVLGTGRPGTVGGYFQEKQGGFSTLTEDIDADQRLWGLHADVAVSDRVSVKLSYDDFDDDDGRTERDGAANVFWQLDERWGVSAGLRYAEIYSPLSVPGYDGSRLDAGLRFDYRWDEDRLAYLFGQGTLDRSGDIRRNNRIGAGVEVAVSDTLAAAGELSYGTLGFGGLAKLTYAPTAGQEYYVGYRVDPDRAFDMTRTRDLHGRDHGTVVAGARRRVDDRATAYAENSYDMFGRRLSLAQSYGVVYTPNRLWTFDAGLEAGHVRDDTVDPATGIERADFDRYAPSLSIGYNDEERGLSGRIRGEVRIEDSDDESRDQTTYLFAAGLGWDTDPDWRMMANIDAVISDSRSSFSAIQDTKYVETSLGYAYRPVDNERLNTLFRYTWVYDMPGTDQRISAATGDSFAPAQRSHILSADTTFDVKPWLSVGGKYGIRHGEVRYRDAAGEDFSGWQTSTAQLGILRADFHFVKNWDILLEGRALHLNQADTTDYGTVTALYRHFGNNFKVGLGYNFGRFSDDLRDVTLDDEGVFVNLVGKF